MPQFHRNSHASNTKACAGQSSAYTTPIGGPSSLCAGVLEGGLDLRDGRGMRRRPFIDERLEL